MNLKTRLERLERIWDRGQDCTCDAVETEAITDCRDDGYAAMRAIGEALCPTHGFFGSFDELVLALLASDANRADVRGTMSGRCFARGGQYG